MNFLPDLIPDLIPRKSDYLGLSKSWRVDALAGITVGIVALPLALAFGITTGAGASAGLITAVLAGLIAAIFGGSHLQVSGPTGAMTVVLVPIVAKYGVSVLVPLGIVAGVLVMLSGIFGLGNLINRVPWSVMEGFTLGIAMVIGLQQMPMALDVVKAHGERTLPVAWGTLENAIGSGLNWKSISIVVATLAIKFATPHVLRRLKITVFIPGSFLAIVIMTALLWEVKVAKVGNLPAKLIDTQKHSLGLQGMTILAFIYAAFSIAALSGIESLLSARVADQMAHHRGLTKTLPNRELFGQGMATIIASLLGGIPATGAIARSSVNVRSGASTRFAAITHSIFLILVITSLGSVISHVPTATLAAVLIGTSIRIASPARMKELLRTMGPNQIVLLTTAATVLLVDLIWGIAIGVALHLILTRILKKKFN
ncbi:MAG: solute carrier family 23 protein [Actinomycetes bacterium]